MELDSRGSLQIPVSFGCERMAPVLFTGKRKETLRIRSSGQDLFSFYRKKGNYTRGKKQSSGPDAQKKRGCAETQPLLRSKDRTYEMDAEFVPMKRRKAVAAFFITKAPYG